MVGEFKGESPGNTRELEEQEEKDEEEDKDLRDEMFFFTGSDRLVTIRVLEESIRRKNREIDNVIQRETLFVSLFSDEISSPFKLLEKKGQDCQKYSYKILFS